MPRVQARLEGLPAHPPPPALRRAGRSPPPAAPATADLPGAVPLAQAVTIDSYGRGWLHPAGRS